MCSITDLFSPEKELSKEQIFHIIDEAASYGIKRVVLTGGEPFLREDIFDICDYSNKRGLQNIITTNGTLINDEVAEEIRKSKIEHISFSIDGLEDTHDFFRGNGLFKKTIDGISILKRKNNNSLSIGIACTVMNRNVGELFELVKLADGMGIDVINFQPLISNNADFSDRKPSPFWVEDEDIGVLEEEIIRIKRYRPRHAIVYEEPSLELLVKYYKGKLTKKDWICFGGFKTIFICCSENQPLVYSCHGVCGSLNNISLKRAWISKEAYKLRIHSKNCDDLCIQSCYSQMSAQSLYNLLKLRIKRCTKTYG